MSKKKRQRQVVLFSHREELPKNEEQAMDWEAAKKARLLKARIKGMEIKIRRYREERYPHKSLVQILRKIREEFGAFGTMVAIAQIKRNQWHRLSMEDKMFVEDEKRSLLEDQPHLKEEMEEDCTPWS